jgi:hypothetical protein
MCGPCKSHQQKVYMPVVPITSACNLDCPICYTVNKNDESRTCCRAEHSTDARPPTRSTKSSTSSISRVASRRCIPLLPEVLADGARRPASAADGLDQRPEAAAGGVRAGSWRRSTRASCSRSTPSTTRSTWTLLGAKTVKSKLKVLDLLEKHDVTTTILPAVPPA